MTTSKRILVVDDDGDILMLFSLWLKKEGYEVMIVESGEKALTQIGINPPHLVITDLFMDGMSGMELLATIHSNNPLLPVIMLSGNAEIPDAVKATHLGSSAFLTKPIKKEELLAQVSKVLRSSPIEEEINQFSKNLIYRSQVMADLVEFGCMVAANDVTIMINGSTGTGKELVARGIHDASPRRDKPYIAVNCGAIPAQLLESELFGHEKGAFTGATSKHEGLFLAANGGTLFLDEIADMPLELQVKLLRVLQDLQVRPVGSTKSFPVDVRIISATHQNLEQAVSDGYFREDLFYRLNVVPLHVPSLSDRAEDVPLLLEHFLLLYAQKNNQKVKRFSPEAIDHLVSLPWPGNVRQLINVVELCATLSKTNMISLSLVLKAIQDSPKKILSLKEAKHNFERNYLISVLKITDGQVSNAAKIAGKNRTEFYKLLANYNIEPSEFRNKDNAS